MLEMYTQFPEAWKPLLAHEFRLPYMNSLNSYLTEEMETHTIYPPESMLFDAFKFTAPNDIKAVILGQDPYHGPNQAHGLCFSVQQGIRPPPSLKNIYKELQSDIGCPIPDHGELTAWAHEGVLLLNTTLTVRAKSPKSHAGQGWEEFTDAVIQAINAENEHVVFFLWGSHAHTKEALIDSSKHCVLKTTHPSPFSAYRGFLGSKQFSLCNSYLIEKGIEPINWTLPEGQYTLI